MRLKDILTWRERCEVHPDHNDGRLVTSEMIQTRMQEEIDQLTNVLREAEERTGNQSAWAQMKLERDIAMEKVKELNVRIQQMERTSRTD